MSALEDGEVAQGDVVAVFESDGLVADSRLLRDETAGAAADALGAVAETLAVDEAGALDADVVQAFAVDEGVGPVVVAVVLVLLPGLGGAGGVVGAAVVAGGFAGHGRGGGEDGAAVGEIERDVGLEADGEADVGACGEEDGASAGGCGGFDGLVDGGRVDGFAVAGGTVGVDVEEDLGCGGRG